MVLNVSNNGYFYATFKSSSSDASPITFSTNLTMLTNTYWLNSALADQRQQSLADQLGPAWGSPSSTNTFKDWRESSQTCVNVTLANSIVGLMTNWMANWLATNANVSGQV